MRWHERPIAQTTLMIAVMVGVVVLQNAVVTQVLPQFSAQKNTPSDDLQKVSANTCPFDSGQAPRNTLTDKLDVARWPISTNRHEYDMLGPGFFDLVQETDAGILNLTKDDGAPVDENAKNLMSNMFGFKPAKLSAAYKLKYASAPQGGDGEYKGPGPVLEVPVDPADPTVKVPNNIRIDADGSVAMVVFAASDRLTIHLARSEHIYDAKYSSGYWIYIKNICVDQQIISKYNKIKAAQESAGANKDKIFLPMLRPGHILGKAQSGNKVLVAVRDNGPLISIFKPFYWGGVPEKNFVGVGPDGSSSPGTNSTATPAAPGSATATPAGALPTATPTTPTKSPTPVPPGATSTPAGSVPPPTGTTVTPVPPTSTPTTSSTSGSSSTTQTVEISVADVHTVDNSQVGDAFVAAIESCNNNIAGTVMSLVEVPSNGTVDPINEAPFTCRVLPDGAVYQLFHPEEKNPRIIELTITGDVDIRNGTILFQFMTNQPGVAAAHLIFN